MVLASHIIFTAYGFWLPNDPRGSWSDFIRSWELFLTGKATTTDERRSVAHRPHDPEIRRAAKRALKFKPVRFTGRQALAVAHGFIKAIKESGYVILACSIMPNHVHIVVLRRARNAETIIGHLKPRATQALVEAGLHPFEQFRGTDGRFPSVWARRGWKVFLDTEEDIVRAIKYAQRNPEKDGLPRQEWSFVQAYQPDASRKRDR